jgi:hypothetical protein
MVAIVNEISKILAPACRRTSHLIQPGKSFPATPRHPRELGKLVIAIPRTYLAFNPPVAMSPF